MILAISVVHSWFTVVFPSKKKKIPRFIKVLEPSKGRKTDMFINLQLVICRVSARCHYARPSTALILNILHASNRSLPHTKNPIALTHINRVNCGLTWYYVVCTGKKKFRLQWLFNLACHRLLQHPFSKCKTETAVAPEWFTYKRGSTDIFN